MDARLMPIIDCHEVVPQRLLFEIIEFTYYIYSAMRVIPNE